MYLIVTFGEPGMKGVQVRGIRIAEALKQAGETVEFLNDGEPTWLAEQGYTVHPIQNQQFMSPEQIGKEIFEKLQPHGIIFAELPTSWPYPTALFFEADRRQIPIIALDNIYSSEQFHDRPFQLVLQAADLLLLNGLSSIAPPEGKHVKVIPPLIEKPKLEKIEYWKKQLNLSPSETLITMVGYHDQAREIAKVIHESLPLEQQPVFAIAGAGNNISERNANEKIILLPFLPPEDITALYSISEVIIGKQGYMQFLEAAVLKKIFISLGTTHGYQTKWLTPFLRDVDFHFDEAEPAIEFLKDLLANSDKRQQIVEKIGRLHDGSFFYPAQVAKLITSATPRSKKYFRKVLLYYREANEDPEVLKKVMQIIENEPGFIWPIIIQRDSNESSMSPTSLNDFLAPERQILKSSFSEIFSLSSHSFHALAQSYPWYSEMMSHMFNLTNTADEVVVVNSTTRHYFEGILRNISASKVHILNP